MKKAINILIWVVLIVGLFIVLGFAYKAHQSMTCDNVDIHIKYNSEDYFITSNDITDFFSQKNIKIKGAPLSDINANVIARALHGIPYIEKTEVFVNIDGNVEITIIQRKPIVKVFNKYNQTFYIDDKGKLMPASESYTAHLPVAIGNIPELYNPNTKLDVTDSASADTLIMESALYNVFRLAQYISKDDFWKSMIDEIFVNSDGDLELFTTIGDHTIIFGDVDNMKEKFDKLLIFYKHGLNKVGWQKYKTINLKYKNQVVCSKI